MEAREGQVNKNDIKTYEIESDNPLQGDVVVVVYGSIDEMTKGHKVPLVRMHSRCLYGEVLDSQDCDCGPQLRESQRMMENEGSGILFYLKDQEGRGAGLLSKARGYKLTHDEGLDTAEAYEKLGLPFDQRDYRHCADFLREHGINHVRLLSNNPLKIKALEDEGIKVELVSLVVGVTKYNVGYLRTKRDKAGHRFPKEL